MALSLIAIPLEKRILIHLFAYSRVSSEYDLPFAITQEGIADAVAVRQSDVSRAIKKMRATGLVAEKSAYIYPPAKQRMVKHKRKVYLLTQGGYSSAQSARGELESTLVRARDGGDEKTISLAALRQRLGDRYSLLELARLPFSGGPLDVEALLESLPQAVTTHIPTGPPLPESRNFLGREEELRHLRALIEKSGVRFIVIYGIAGVGKTALAAKLLEGRAAPSFFRFYYRFREWSTLKNLLTSLAEALPTRGAGALRRLVADSAAAPGLHEATEALGRELSSMAGLVVFDDVHLAPAEVMALFTELLDMALPKMRFLLLSRELKEFYDRRHVAVTGVVQEMELRGLDRAAARKLLGPQVPVSQFEQIYRTTRGHPLALELMRAGGEGRPRQNIEKFVQEEVLSALGPKERVLLERACVHRRPFRTESLFDPGERELTFDTLDSLVRRSVVRPAGDGRLEMHDLLREFFLSRLTPAASVECHRRAAVYWTHEKDDIEVLHHLSGAEDYQGAGRLLAERGWLQVEQGRGEEIMAVLNSMRGNYPPEYVSHLYALRERILNLWGEWDDVGEYRRQWLEIAPHHPPPSPIARSREAWATAEEEHRKSIEILQSLGDENGLFNIRMSMAWLHRLQGRLDEAEREYRHCLATVGKPASARRMRSLKESAVVACEMMKWSEGEKRLGEAAEIASSVAAPPSEVVAALNWRALAFERLDRIADAVEAYSRALDRANASRQSRSIGYTRLHRGALQVRAGNARDGRAELDAAREIFRNSGDRLGVAYCSIWQGICTEKMGEGQRAGSFREAVELLREGEDAGGMELDELIGHLERAVQDRSGPGTG